MEDLEQLKEIGEAMKRAALCGLGQTAPNPVLSSLHYFYDEYLEHINEKKCRAGKCKKLITYTINDNCRGCTLCARKCPVNCISGEVRQKHIIDQTKCIKCGECMKNCKFDAIEKR